MNYIIAGTKKKISESRAKARNAEQMRIFNEVFSAPAGKRDFSRLLDFDFFIREDLIAQA